MISFIKQVNSNCSDPLRSSHRREDDIRRFKFHAGCGVSLGLDFHRNNVSCHINEELNFCAAIGCPVVGLVRADLRQQGLEDGILRHCTLELRITGVSVLNDIGFHSAYLVAAVLGCEFVEYDCGKMLRSRDAFHIIESGRVGHTEKLPEGGGIHIHFVHLPDRDLHMFALNGHTQQ